MQSEMNVTVRYKSQGVERKTFNVDIQKLKVVLCFFTPLSPSGRGAGAVRRLGEGARRNPNQQPAPSERSAGT